MITTPEQAEADPGIRQADLVLLAREILRDPYFAGHAAKALAADLKPPKQYLRAW